MNVRGVSCAFYSYTRGWRKGNFMSIFISAWSSWHDWCWQDLNFLFTDGFVWILKEKKRYVSNTRWILFFLLLFLRHKGLNVASGFLSGQKVRLFVLFFYFHLSGYICKMSNGVPADMINLRLILVSGKTKEFLFSPNDSAADIAKHVYDNWPMDWEEEQVSSPNILRLIYQGRFLHGNVTLGALKLPLGKTTVMHLVARETLPEPNSQGQRNREKTGESNCCVIL